MKDLLNTIVTGYLLFLRRLGVFSAVIALFLLLAALLGYPLWYWATTYPDTYTAAGLILLSALLFSSGLIRFIRILRNQGFEQVKDSMRKTAVYAGRAVLVLGGVISVVFFYSRGNIPASLISLLLSIAVWGIVFFAAANET